MIDSTDSTSGDSSPEAVRDKGEATGLSTLASGFSAEHHQTYLRHLQQAVAGPKNLNIALTGRYGTGKSSILDEFEAECGAKTTLRISISTLGPQPDATPDGESERQSLSNRIQKELVKQLLYRAAPRTMRFSRFTRIVPLSWKRAYGEAIVAVGMIAGALALLGWFPRLNGTGPGNPGWVSALSVLGLVVVAVAVVATLRRVIHGRLVVSDVSAAGATVKLTQRTSTYFDEYLDEIVYFFDEKFPAIVIFEDLDRFDDPHIFEALRELNGLLNHTAKRVKKKKPLRFVYAIKDSLFETLGEEIEPVAPDAAHAETIRANRTKFFDIVIPVVPFVSHRNARELLAGILDTAGVTGIDRRLIALVAQNATDMRLLKNIANEYTVFAERLLSGDNVAPGLTGSSLFALVAYKNFHLKDFENIARRDSDLDLLYKRRREIVRAAIDSCEQRRRDLLKEPVRIEMMEPLARKLGDRLVAVGHAIKEGSSNSPGIRRWPYVSFRLNTAMAWSTEDEVRSCDFWREAIKADTVALMASSDRAGGSTHEFGSLSHQRVEDLFPEAMDAGRWAELDERAHQAAILDLDNEITFLRRADFSDLLSDCSAAPSTEAGKIFADFVGTTLKSKLAVKLVEQGFLDRNFTLYAAQFYGDFTGVDVATFIVQSVQPNVMDVDFSFSGPEAIANLLAEAPEDFPQTTSAYNLQVVDYLLERSDPRATSIATSITANFNDDARIFLRAYLNAGSSAKELIGLLSRLQWPLLFTYLVQEDSVPETIRIDLVSIALKSSVDGGKYHLDTTIGQFIGTHYEAMTVFTEHQPTRVTRKVVDLIKATGIALTDLAPLSTPIRNRVVQQHLYAITADNLRHALGGPGDISLDRVRQSPAVYRHCLENPNAYLTAAKNDTGATAQAIQSTDTLTTVLSDVDETWDSDQVRQLLELTSLAATLEQLDTVPTPYWTLLAAHGLFRPTVANILTYLDTTKPVDQPLAELLNQAQAIDAHDENDARCMQVAVTILNAAHVLPNPGLRVKLVLSLALDDHVDPEEIEPEPGELLAILLEHDLVPDTLASFTRFTSAGWDALEPAIAKSSKFTQFMTPALVSGHVEDLLLSPDVPSTIKRTVITELEQYVLGDDARALSEAGNFAVRRNFTPPWPQLRRIARVTREANLTLQLLSQASSLPSTADVIAVLGELGEPYSNLVSHTADSFSVPNDQPHKKIFAYLKQAGAIADVTRPRLLDRPITVRLL
ncbi:hypothetical protein NQK81_05860 [Amycolatopsis roodepoortensis]|uniref:YobI family P-loop NTPase n=1 Tax=Amycolatopsis roodepoortensis TaxID=700274 RepID=UPI00214CFBE9|nr:hypothetical protein [Amycolatopsis roodepoortensis]UUV32977.1 hypothetical protein NQK81_05860 [Amycolatopsis roodepoortensis]